MENGNCAEDRPDVFGPFFPGMINIHNTILEYIKKMPDVNQQTVMLLMQCNFAEIVSSWERTGFQKPVFVTDIQDVSDLAMPDWEMILSVHFYFDKTHSDDGIPDTQYFKIVYTHSSLVNNLDKIRKIL